MGEVKLAGAKNAGFKAMVAALLANSPSRICGLGLVSEIDFAGEVIRSLGGKVKETDDAHSLEVDPGNLNSFEIPLSVGQKSRSSTMYVGPLLKKFSKAILPVPGGDKIGKRPIERHLEGLESLGAEINFRNGTFYVRAKNGLKGANYKFKKNTHTGTETLLMTAVFADGVTVLENSAAEPEVDDLIKILNKMGARVQRVEPRTIKIEGVNNLSGANHSVMKDRIEVGTLACMALATKGDVFIKGADPGVIKIFLEKIETAGGGIEINPQGIRFFYKGGLKAVDVLTEPYPGFMTDWQPLWTTFATQTEGESVLHETIYENRFGHVPYLQRMGAEIELFNPSVENPEAVYNFNIEDDSPENKHAIRVFGPAKLRGIEVEINDIRFGATMLFAGMIAEGTTLIIDPKDQIKRGYEKLPERLQELGAQIKIEPPRFLKEVSLARQVRGIFSIK